MLKLSKFKIIFGITTFATAVTLPFLILSINQKTIKNDKNISETTFSKTLKSESLKVISALKQKNAESFSSTNENTEARINDFSKFEKDFQDYIDEVSENPNLNFEKIAKEKLLKKGVTADNIEKIFASQNSKNNKIQNQDLLVKPQSFSSRNTPNLKMKEFANKLWNQHVSNAAFAAINYGLAVAYGVIWLWWSALASAAAGAVSTTLSVLYKDAYNSLVYDKNWDAIKETDTIYWTKEVSKASSRFSIVSSGYKIWEMWQKLKSGQAVAVVALNAVKWVNPQIILVLSAIDVIQSVISLG
ncbi:hypothetical protein [Mesomycoplasma ovipneumoniae]|uniref:Uncharacterized protein n=1 Tax=Mesomycoplasma ovipneumoniae TaxID=29562 RepID=A0AAJ2P7W2_9BACT|nr:hypothetical protein [Mesomycoplasma ovipneumoniae]MDW2860873.1 hypothetical protein [Mesomycoplasma ovipneumoniae]MDW2891820.1 hypothetical protein [Mesomycoplasma ovipneumoniae]MDW2897871.1 hypothetical protein [Mesomycoplasma ovipneumoniae]